MPSDTWFHNSFLILKKKNSRSTTPQGQGRQGWTELMIQSAHNLQTPNGKAPAVSSPAFIHTRRIFKRNKMMRLTPTLSAGPIPLTSPSSPPSRPPPSLLNRSTITYSLLCSPPSLFLSVSVWRAGMSSPSPSSQTEQAAGASPSVPPLSTNRIVVSFYR